jgi:menaquinone-dependent protoporphyrinogen IX oxidase
VGKSSAAETNVHAGFSGRWLSEAPALLRFVRAHRELLSRVPSAFVSVNLAIAAGPPDAPHLASNGRANSSS